MTVVCPVPEIVNLDLDESGFGGFGDDAVLEGAGEKVGKYCKKVKTQILV
jgi:hypothetical protein